MSTLSHKMFVACAVMILVPYYSYTKDCIENISQQKQSNSIVSTEKRLVIVTPSYNNKEWYQRNLDSIFNQHYDNYRVIYIDDCSPDGTGNLVEQYIKEKGQEHRVTLIKNEKRKGVLANHFKTIHMCDDYEIILTLDGDDWFKHDYVLARINEVYQDSNVWATYGQHELYPINKLGQCQEFPFGVMFKNIYREYDWVASQLRTFYAWFFKQIKLEDLLDNGSFFSAAGDLALMFPIIEMTREHCRFIPDIVYVYNVKSPINDFKINVILQKHCEYVLRARKRYEPIEEPPLPSKSHPDKAALVIFSHNNPLQLATLLESIQHYVHGIDDIRVLYTTTNNNSAKAYEKVRATFNTIQFINQASSSLPFKSLLLENVSHDYIMFAHDTVVITEMLDVQQCIKALEKTHGYAFYCTLGKDTNTHNALARSQKIPPLVHINDDIYAWQFATGEYSWRDHHTFSMALYRKDDIVTQFTQMNFDTSHDLEAAWDKIQFDWNKVGLCFEHSKARLIETQLMQEQQHNVARFKPWIHIDFDESMKTDYFSKEIAFTKRMYGLDGTILMDFFRKLYQKNSPLHIKPQQEPKIPKIIHQIWLGSKLPELFMKYTRTWVEHHLDGWEYKLWTDEDVKQLTLHNQEYFDAAQNYALKADILRLELIYQFGGVYVDIDCECLQSLDILHHTYDFYVGIQPLDAYFVQLANGLFGAIPGHPIVQHAIETVKDNWDKRNPSAKAGPIHCTKSFFAVAGKGDTIDIALPATYFYPLGCFDKIIDKEKWIQQGAFSVHYWAKSWMPPQYRTGEFKHIKNEVSEQHWND